MAKFHSFDVAIAEEYGVNAAIIFQNLSFWIEHNKANGKHFNDGHFWTYNSVTAFLELFPYMGRSQIMGALKKLEENDLIITGNYNSTSYDRTKWYALTKKGESLANGGMSESTVSASSIVQKSKMDNAEIKNGFSEKGKPIPDIKPDAKPDRKTKEKPPHAENPHTVKTPQSGSGAFLSVIESLWLIYPKKQGGKTEKQRAAVAYAAAIAEGATPEQIERGVVDFAAHVKADSTYELKYAPMLSRFIADARYLDEYGKPSRENLAAVLNSAGQGGFKTEEEREHAEALRARLREKFAKPQPDRAKCPRCGTIGSHIGGTSYDCPTCNAAFTFDANAQRATAAN